MAVASWFHRIMGTLLARVRKYKFLVAPSVYISAATLLLSWVAVYKIGLGLVVSSLALSLSGWIIVVAHLLSLMILLVHTRNGIRVAYQMT